MWKEYNNESTTLLRDDLTERTWTCDAQIVNDRLNADATRLFTPNVDELEIWAAHDAKSDGQREYGSPLVVETFSGSVREDLHEYWKVGI